MVKNILIKVITFVIFITFITSCVDVTIYNATIICAKKDTICEKIDSIEYFAIDANLIQLYSLDGNKYVYSTKDYIVKLKPIKEK